MRVLVIYAYFDGYKSSENLEFFQDYGMYLKSNVDYILCVNGTNLSVRESERWDKVIFRNNVGYDFGAWREVLGTVDELKYDYFVFINNTVRGPFGDRYWIYTFCDLLDHEVKLAGITVNCHTGMYTPFFGKKSVPHIQSMLWCTDRIGLEIINPIFVIEEDKTSVVINLEMGISQRILTAGYNIRCILKPYDADYTREDTLINTDNGAYGDPWYTNSYFNRSLHPFETIFYKTNRGINEEELERCSLIQRYNRWY